MLSDVQVLEVHPRSRGEYRLLMPLILTSVGSSPLTRGIQWLGFDGSRTHGFIPAHAGNTRYGQTCPSPGRVHPRSRGEYQRFVEQIVPGVGSSPLTRGIQSLTAVCPRFPRFIPAHAGNTEVYFLYPFLIQVHPRSRGEYFLKKLALSVCKGSSPLTRGILV